MTNKLIEDRTYKMMILPGFEDLLSDNEKAAHDSGEHEGASAGTSKAKRGREQCGEKCTGARGVVCNCICGGVNHGRVAASRITLPKTQT